jgi:hypothetical protein
MQSRSISIYDRVFHASWGGESDDIDAIGMSTVSHFEELDLVSASFLYV